MMIVFNRRISSNLFHSWPLRMAVQHPLASCHEQAPYCAVDPLLQLRLRDRLLLRPLTEAAPRAVRRLLGRPVAHHGEALLFVSESVQRPPR